MRAGVGPADHDVLAAAVPRALLRIHTVLGDEVAAFHELHVRPRVPRPLGGQGVLDPGRTESFPRLTFACLGQHVGEDGGPPDKRDLVLYPRHFEKSSEGFAWRRVSELSEHVDPGTYPLLFPAAFSSSFCLHLLKYFKD